MQGKCRDCEFCFTGETPNRVCADRFYGADVTGSLDTEKECYSEGLEQYSKRMQKMEIVFIPGTKVRDLKVNGGTNITLIDLEGKSISIKALKSKVELGNIDIVRQRNKNEYVVNSIFNRKSFNGERHIILK